MTGFDENVDKQEERIRDYMNKIRLNKQISTSHNLLTSYQYPLQDRSLRV